MIGNANHHVGRRVCRSKDIAASSSCSKYAIRRDIVVEAAALNIVLSIRADTQQVVTFVGYPVDHLSGYTVVRLVSNRRPTTNFLRIARTEANLVALKPTTFVGERRTFSVYTCTKLELL